MINAINYYRVCYIRHHFVCKVSFDLDLSRVSVSVFYLDNYICGFTRIPHRVPLGRDSSVCTEQPSGCVHAPESRQTYRTRRDAVHSTKIYAIEPRSQRLASIEQSEQVFRNKYIYICLIKAGIYVVSPSVRR